MGMQSAARSEFRIGLFYVVLGTLLFSTKGLFIKYAYLYSVSPTLLLTLRMLFALPCYLWMLRRQCAQGGCVQLSRRQLLLTGMFGVAGYYIASWLDLAGLLYLPVNLERLILYTYPAMVLLLSAVFLGQRIERKLGMSLALVSVGLMLVLVQTHRGSAGAEAVSHAWVAGALLVFASALSFSVFFVGSEVMMRRLGSGLFTSIAMLVASGAISVHFLLAHPVEQLFQQAPQVYACALVLALFCTVLPSYLVAAGVSRTGAAAGSLVGGVGPLFTLLLAFVLLGESLSATQLAGFVLVIGGVLNLTRLRRGGPAVTMRPAGNHGRDPAARAGCDSGGGTV